MTSTHYAPSFSLRKCTDGEYRYTVKYDEFVVVQNWYEKRAKRLSAVFAKDPAHEGAQRIWSNCRSDFGIADKMYNLHQQSKLTLE